MLSHIPLNELFYLIMMMNALPSLPQLVSTLYMFPHIIIISGGRGGGGEGLCFKRTAISLRRSGLDSIYTSSPSLLNVNHSFS